MTELIRQDTEYAMRVLVYLAVSGKQKPVAARELARNRDIPEDFIYKILRKLTKAGLTASELGYHGGFRLANGPGEITLWKVINAIQGPVTIKKCCLDTAACSKTSVCEFLPKLIELQNSLTKSLDAITLADVMKQESNI
jgi:Rrf2 family protein